MTNDQREKFAREHAGDLGEMTEHQRNDCIFNFKSGWDACLASMSQSTPEKVSAIALREYRDKHGCTMEQAKAHFGVGYSIEARVKRLEAQLAECQAARDENGERADTFKKALAECRRERDEARSDDWYRKAKGLENIAVENKRIFALLEKAEAERELTQTKLEEFMSSFSSAAFERDRYKLALEQITYVNADPKRAFWLCVHAAKKALGLDET